MKGVFLAVLVAVLSAQAVEGAGLTLDIRDGKVTLDAQDVTTRQILTEWARVGGTLITNVERLSGAPITLRLDGVQEREALDIILRSAAGYMAAPRAEALPGRSMYDRILILAVSTVTAAPRPPANASPNISTLRPTPALNIPGMMAQPDPDEEEEEDVVAAPGRPPGPLGPLGPLGIVQPGIFGPGQSGFAQPGMVAEPLRAPVADPESAPAGAPPAAGSPANPWNVPAGAATPGMPSPPQTVPPVPRQGPTLPSTLQSPPQPYPQTLPPPQPDR